MFHQTVYRVVPEAQTLTHLSTRARNLGTPSSKGDSFVRAYDSAELAAFCCSALWASLTISAKTGRNGLVRETIVVPWECVQATESARIPLSAGDALKDEAALWDRMRATAQAHGLFCVFAPSVHAPGLHVVLLDIGHPSFSAVTVCRRHLGMSVDSSAAPFEVRPHAMASQ